MARKRYKAEEIVSKLRQVDVLVSQGTKVPDAVRSIGVTDVTYYRWRREYRWFADGPGQADEGPRAREPAPPQGGVRSDARQADPG